jgi:hypothetical protein
MSAEKITRPWNKARKHERYRKTNRPHFASQDSSTMNEVGERTPGRYRATICENVGKVMLTFDLVSSYKNFSRSVCRRRLKAENCS